MTSSSVPSGISLRSKSLFKHLYVARQYHIRGSQPRFLIRILVLLCSAYLPCYCHLQFVIQPDTAAQLDVRSFNQRSKPGTFRVRRTINHGNPTDFSICCELSLAECSANFRGDTISAGLRVQEAILTTNYCKTRHPSSTVNTAKVQESQYRNLPSNTESLHLPK